MTTDAASELREAYLRYANQRSWLKKLNRHIQQFDLASHCNGGTRLTDPDLHMARRLLDDCVANAPALIDAARRLSDLLGDSGGSQLHTV